MKASGNAKRLASVNSQHSTPRALPSKSPFFARGVCEGEGWPPVVLHTCRIALALALLPFVLWHQVFLSLAQRPLTRQIDARQIVAYSRVTTATTLTRQTDACQFNSCLRGNGSVGDSVGEGSEVALLWASMRSYALLCAPLGFYALLGAPRPCPPASSPAPCPVPPASFSQSPM